MQITVDMLANAIKAAHKELTENSPDDWDYDAGSADALDVVTRKIAGMIGSTGNMLAAEHFVAATGFDSWSLSNSEWTT